MIDYDSLFAMRVAFQDVHNDENDIIKELKTELRISGMNDTDIDDYLVGFYKHFGIDISKEIISNINNQVENDSDLDDEMPPLINPDTSNNINIFINEYNNISSLPPLPPFIQHLTSTTPTSTNTISTSDNSNNQIPFIPNISQNNSNSIFRSRLYGFRNNSQPTQNTTSANNFLSSANLLLNLLNNMNIPTNNNMEDIQVTLDKNELNNIKVHKLEKKLEQTCSVCMCDMNKEEEVSILPCDHIFHKDCINEWLVNYNYKCPICRKECGKSSYQL